MDIFVGSLPFKLKEEELKALFEKFGEVISVTIIINPVTRQNKGFGFVKMSNDIEAIEAIKKLDGFEILERQIIVSKAEPRRDNKSKNERSDKPSENHSTSKTWSSKLYKKKPKDQVITYGDKPKKDKDNEMGRKKAKNFKVGSRKKR